MVCRKTALGLSLAVLLFAGLPSIVGAQIIHVPTETPEQGKAFSEFNHRMAGVFLLAIGLLAIGSLVDSRLSFLGKFWPFLFLLPGLYLAAMSDPEVWPMGTQTWVQVFESNPEARQHKVFALLLIAMGVLEFQRARGKLGRFLATWSFPALAVFGAALLFFHPHNVDELPGDKGQAMAAMSHEAMGHEMPGTKQAQGAGAPQHGGHVMTEAMIKVQNQHFWFSLVGFAVALFKFLHDGNFWKKAYVPYLWPGFIAVLGVLLIFYAE